MRRAARLHADQARGQLGEKWQHLRPPKRLTNHNLTGRINAVALKNALGRVEADRGNLHSGWLPFCSRTPDGLHTLAPRCREREPSTPSAFAGKSPMAGFIRHCACPGPGNWPQKTFAS